MQSLSCADTLFKSHLLLPLFYDPLPLFSGNYLSRRIVVTGVLWSWIWVHTPRKLKWIIFNIISDPPSAALDLFLPIWVQFAQFLVCVRVLTSYLDNLPAPRAKFLQLFDQQNCLMVLKLYGKYNISPNYCWLVIFKHPGRAALRA